MQLKTITVGNYKNIAETSLNLSKINAFISQNNYGKSNLLEAIRFGFAFLKASPLSRSQMMRDTRAIPFLPALKDKEFVFSVEFDAPELKEYRSVRYGFKFQWLTDNQEAAITDETLEARKSKTDPYKAYLKYPTQEYRTDKKKSSFRHLRLPENTLMIDVLSEMDSIDIAAVAARVKSLSCFEAMAPAPGYPPLAFSAGTDSDIPSDDKAIVNLLVQMKRDCPFLYDLFAESTCNLFPEIRSIRLQTLSEFIESHPKDLPPVRRTYQVGKSMYCLTADLKFARQPVEIQYLSAGTKRILRILANVFYRSTLGVTVIEIKEIETAVHPRIIEPFLKILVGASVDTKLLITSNSPYVIQYLKPESIYIGIPDETGTARFRNIRSDMAKRFVNDAEELGMSTGEYVFDLLSCDDDALDILNAYLKK